MYSLARFQCNNEWPSAVDNDVDERPALTVICNLWERAAEQKDRQRLLAPLALLLGLLSVAGITPLILRRMLTLAQSLSLTARARLSIVRALRTAGAGASRPVISKVPPRHFFSFGGSGLKRSINGLSTWPFRNDFGMAVWLRQNASIHRFIPSC